jgi:hypothetical protein
MHSGNLVLEHALGTKIRTKNRQVVDSFKEGKEICKRIYSNFSWIMDKRNKHRFERFNVVSNDIYQCNALKLVLPNETRVSGKYYMIQLLLRQHHLYQHFTQHDETYGPFFGQNNNIFSEADLKFIQELEGDIRPFNLLNIGAQSDQPGYIAFSWFTISFVQATISRRPSFTMYVLKKRWPPSTLVSKIPNITRDRSELSEHTLTFIARIEKEFDHYFPHPDMDMRLAVYCHPAAMFQVLE